jgi:hypothetical protein
MNKTERKKIRELLSLLYPNYEMFDEEDHENIVGLIKEICPEALEDNRWE